MRKIIPFSPKEHLSVCRTCCSSQTEEKANTALAHMVLIQFFSEGQATTLKPFCDGDGLPEKKYHCIRLLPHNCGGLSLS